MRALVLDSSPELAELIGIYLASLGSAEVVATSRMEEAAKHLEGGQFQVFLCAEPFVRAGNDLAARLWRERFPQGLLVLVGDAAAATAEHHAAHAVTYRFLVEDLRGLVKTPAWGKLSGRASDQPLPLSPHLVYRLGVCPADLFIKLGAENWVKVFHGGSPFGEEERARFEARGLKEFWILAGDVQEALAHFENLLGALAADDPSAGGLVSDAAELVWHTIQASGFRPEVQELVQKNVRQTMLFIKEHADLQTFFNRMFRPEHGPVVRHALLTAHVACAVATQLGWTSGQTYLKLTVASLMHDTFLPNFEWAESRWAEAAAASKGKPRPPSEVKVFFQHPVDGAQLLRRFKQIPPDTDKIVLEHHELPDGSGFPRGLPGAQISPLGCLFILSHHAAEALLERFSEGERWDMERLLELLVAERWQAGNFKKVWQAFEKTPLFP